MTINAVLQDNGIIIGSKKSKEANRMAEIKEIVNMEITNNRMAIRMGGNIKTKEEVIEKLFADKRITQEEYDALMNGATEITIAGETINFAVIENPEIVPPETGGNTGETGGNEGGNTGETGGNEGGNSGTGNEGNGSSTGGDNLGPATQILSGETETITASGNNRGYIGYYADLNGDGTITIEDDGIIYADLAINVPNTYIGTSGWGAYGYSRPSGALKDYMVKNGTVANDIFKTGKGIISEKSGSSGFDRFYVMALEDFTLNNMTNYYYYYNATAMYLGYMSGDPCEFDIGISETKLMIDKWNNSQYGTQITESSGMECIDLWGAIQRGKYNIVRENDTSYTKKWFVPSKPEWNAFSANIQVSNEPTNDYYYEKLGLKYEYWASTQVGNRGPTTYKIYTIRMEENGYCGLGGMKENYPLRLSTVF